MSTPLGSSQLFKSGSFYAHEIDQSLRFENGDTPYLSRTPSSAGNRKTFTVSLWVKRGDSENFSEYLFHTSLAGANAAAYLYYSQDTLAYWDTTLVLQTTGVFRDHSAWYHVVLAVDTTQATASNRSKLYINGEQITDLGTESQKSQNYDSYFNSTTGHYIGDDTSSTGVDGYVAEVHFIDGSALAPTSFGETKSGIWIPKAYTGSYGTNGFYLDFADGSALGDDESGNANDFTASGLAATDVVLDSPTNSFCNITPLAGAGMTLSEGNLKVATTTNNRGRYGTFGVSSGKWYFEVEATDYTTGGGLQLGWGHRPEEGDSENPYNHGFGVSSYDGSVYIEGTQSTATGYTSKGANYTSDGDIYGIVLDVDNEKLYVHKNGTYFNSADPAAGTGGVDVSSSFTAAGSRFMLPMIARGGSYNETYTFNFGQDDTFAGNIASTGNADGNGNGVFKYSVPSGFLALCTANLSNPNIDPQKDQTPEDHFNTVLYTGNGSTQSITGVGFQPDWVWLKSRTGVYDHTVYDVIRGATYKIAPNDEYASTADADTLTSFDSDGFSLGDDVKTNASSGSMVSWNWLAGGTAVSNDDGSIASSVSANTKAGFSIVKYTGDGTATTVGHGLDSAPEMYMIKNMSSSDNWVVYHKDLTSASYYLTLDTTNSEFSNNVVFNGTDSTSTVFSVGTSRSTDGDNYIAYCFHSVPGYSKMGTYEGNASNDGPFVFCGFRPAFLMVKTIDKAGGWHIFDNLRAFAGNEIDVRLEADNADDENTSGPPHMDLLSNGFKLRSSFDNINPSSTMVFMAFAEQPFKYSNAR